MINIFINNIFYRLLTKVLRIYTFKNIYNDKNFLNDAKFNKKTVTYLNFANLFLCRYWLFLTENWFF